MEQLAHVGSEVGRAAQWYGKDQQRCEQPFIRALELLDLTIADDRWRGRRKKLTRTREVLCDAMQDGTEYGSNLAALDRYFLHIAVAARAGRDRQMIGHTLNKTWPWNFNGQTPVETAP